MCESCSPTVGLGVGVVDEGKTAYFKLLPLATVRTYVCT